MAYKVESFVGRSYRMCGFFTLENQVKDTKSNFLNRFVMNMKTVRALFLFVAPMLTGCHKAHHMHMNAENAPPPLWLENQAKSDSDGLGGIKIHLPNGTQYAFYPLEDGQWVATVVDRLGCSMQNLPVKFAKEIPSMDALTSLAPGEQERWMHIQETHNGNKIVYLGKVGLMGGGFYRAHTCDRAGCENKWRVCERCEGNPCDEGASGWALAGMGLTHMGTVAIGSFGHVGATAIYQSTGRHDPRDNYETIIAKRYCWTHCSCSGICKTHRSCPDCDQCTHCKRNCKQCCGCAARIKREKAAAERAAREAEQYFLNLEKQRKREEEEAKARTSYFCDSSSDDEMPARNATRQRQDDQAAKAAAFQAAFSHPTGVNVDGTDRPTSTSTSSEPMRNK